MKILIPVLSFGRQGGYKVLSKLADEFIKKGHEVTFITSANSPTNYYDTQARIIWVSNNGDFLNHPSTTQPRSLLYTIRCLLRALNKIEDYDIVLANQSLTTIPIYLSKIKAKRFYYIQADEPLHYKNMIGIKAFILTYLSRLSYYLPFSKIVNTPLYLNHKYIRSNYLSLPGMNLAKYTPKKNYQQKPVSRPWRIGTIARKEAFKGTGYVMDAFKELKRYYPEIELHLAFAEQEMQSIINGVYVCFPDGEEKLSEYYKYIDIYVCAGTIEFGAVHYPVIESMACGTTVVTTPYYPATVDNSWIIGAKSVQNIVSAIKSIIEASEMEINERKKQALTDIQIFSWDNVSNKMLEAFEMKG